MNSCSSRLRGWRSLFLGGVFLFTAISATAAEWRYRPDLTATFKSGPVRIPTSSRFTADTSSPAQMAKSLSIISVDKDGKTFTKELTEADLPAYTTGTKGRTTAFAGTEAEVGLRKIIGEDTRVQVTATKTMPYRAIGRIEVGCTGTLIGSRYVLTAGHCVYDDWGGNWYKDLTFYPGQNGKELPYGKFEWERVFAVQGWTDGGDTNFDFALIVLKEPIGEKVGWHAIGYDTALTQANLLVAGYPGDKTEGEMWESTCPILETHDQQIHYECDTYPGNSGSAVLADLPEGKTVVTVHTNGYPTYNRGTRLTSAIFKHLTDWQLP